MPITFPWMLTWVSAYFLRSRSVLCSLFVFYGNVYNNFGDVPVTTYKYVLFLFGFIPLLVRLLGIFDQLPKKFTESLWKNNESSVYWTNTQLWARVDIFTNIMNRIRPNIDPRVTPKDAICDVDIFSWIMSVLLDSFRTNMYRFLWINSYWWGCRWRCRKPSTDRTM